jgi:hypothetical protein
MSENTTKKAEGSVLTPEEAALLILRPEDEEEAAKLILTSEEQKLIKEPKQLNETQEADMPAPKFKTPSEFSMFPLNHIPLPPPSPEETLEEALKERIMIKMREIEKNDRHNRDKKKNPSSSKTFKVLNSCRVMATLSAFNNRKPKNSDPKENFEFWKKTLNDDLNADPIQDDYYNLDNIYYDESYKNILTWLCLDEHPRSKVFNEGYGLDGFGPKIFTKDLQLIPENTQFNDEEIKKFMAAADKFIEMFGEETLKNHYAALRQFHNENRTKNQSYDPFVLLPGEEEGISISNSDGLVQKLRMVVSSSYGSDFSSFFTQVSDIIKSHDDLKAEEIEKQAAEIQAKEAQENLEKLAKKDNIEATENDTLTGEGQKIMITDLESLAKKLLEYALSNMMDKYLRSIDENPRRTTPKKKSSTSKLKFVRSKSNSSFFDSNRTNNDRNFSPEPSLITVFSKISESRSVNDDIIKEKLSSICENNQDGQGQNIISCSEVMNVLSKFYMKGKILGQTIKSDDDIKAYWGSILNATQDQYSDSKIDNPALVFREFSKNILAWLCLPNHSRAHIYSEKSKLQSKNERDNSNELENKFNPQDIENIISVAGQFIEIIGEEGLGEYSKKLERYYEENPGANTVELQSIEREKEKAEELLKTTKEDLVKAEKAAEDAQEALKLAREKSDAKALKSDAKALEDELKDATTKAATTKAVVAAAVRKTEEAESTFILLDKKEKDLKQDSALDDQAAKDKAEKDILKSKVLQLEAEKATLTSEVEKLKVEKAAIEAKAQVKEELNKKDVELQAPAPAPVQAQAEAEAEALVQAQAQAQAAEASQKTLNDTKTEPNELKEASKATKAELAAQPAKVEALEKINQDLKQNIDQVNPELHKARIADSSDTDLIYSQENEIEKSRNPIKQLETEVQGAEKPQATKKARNEVIKKLSTSTVEAIFNHANKAVLEKSAIKIQSLVRGHIARKTQTEEIPKKTPESDNSLTKEEIIEKIDKIKNNDQFNLSEKQSQNHLGKTKFFNTNKVMRTLAKVRAIEEGSKKTKGNLGEWEKSWKTDNRKSQFYLTNADKAILVMLGMKDEGIKKVFKTDPADPKFGFNFDKIDKDNIKNIMDVAFELINKIERGELTKYEGKEFKASKSGELYKIDEKLDEEVSNRRLTYKKIDQDKSAPSSSVEKAGAVRLKDYNLILSQQNSEKSKSR